MTDINCSFLSIKQAIIKAGNQSLILHFATVQLRADFSSTGLFRFHITKKERAIDTRSLQNNYTCSGSKAQCSGERHSELNNSSLMKKNSFGSLS